MHIGYGVKLNEFSSKTVLKTDQMLSLILAMYRICLEMNEPSITLPIARLFLYHLWNQYSLNDYTTNFLSLINCLCLKWKFMTASSNLWETFTTLNTRICNNHIYTIYKLLNMLSVVVLTNLLTETFANCILGNNNRE